MCQNIVQLCRRMMTILCGESIAKGLRKLDVARPAFHRAQRKHQSLQRLRISIHHLQVGSRALEELDVDSLISDENLAGAGLELAQVERELRDRLGHFWRLVEIEKAASTPALSHALVEFLNDFKQFPEAEPHANSIRKWGDAHMQFWLNRKCFADLYPTELPWQVNLEIYNLLTASGNVAHTALMDWEDSLPFDVKIRSMPNVRLPALRESEARTIRVLNDLKRIMGAMQALIKAIAAQGN